MSQNVNIIRDQIFTCIEISKRSKVPMLFISNPGYGKTTSINLYAKKNGYHVETLIGSHYSQDEILGFQANTGEKHLSILEPEWFTRIKIAKSKNIPSILFLDELSTVSPSVQGALLQLCFERKIRGGKSLPEDCIVIAAANYKQNLPGFSDIIAPELNRFCIINILPSINNSLYNNAISILDEFTQDFHEVSSNLPEFKINRQFNPTEEKEFLNIARSKLKSLFQNHSLEKSTSLNPIDFRNILYDGIYDRMDDLPEVYNFVSPRTISYYLRVIKTICEMGLSPDNRVVYKVEEGLLGLGTNSFNSDNPTARKAQIKFFLTELHNISANLIECFSSTTSKDITKLEEQAETFDPTIYNNTLAGKIKNYISEHDRTRIMMNSELTSLLRKIGTTFDTTRYEYTVKKLKENPSQFRSDYESIMLLHEIISDKRSSTNSYDITMCLKSLKSIINKFNSVYQKSFCDSLIN